MYSDFSCFIWISFCPIQTYVSKEKGFLNITNLFDTNTWPDRLLADVRIFGWLSLFGQIFFLVAAGLKEAVGMTMDVLGRVVHVSC